jgi:hypothetical protein
MDMTRSRNTSPSQQYIAIRTRRLARRRPGAALDQPYAACPAAFSRSSWISV